MRTVTAAQQIVLGLKRRSTYLRITVDRTGAGAWVDLTDLEGWDWVERVRISRNVDNNVKDATVTLRRNIFKLNLATFDNNSKLNVGGTLIDMGQKILIETATVGYMSKPASGDWVEKLRGEIDIVDTAKNPITIRCRDDGATPSDRFIETQQKYPADPATFDDVEDIMQEILDNELGVGIIDLYSENGTAITPFNPGDSPGWVIGEYIQKKQHIMQALRVLATQIGWDIRYKWQVNTGSFELVFSEPDRVKSTPDWTFENGLYMQPSRLVSSRIDVRNVIKVVYTDGATGVRSTVVRTDASSITKYGRRFMEIAEGSSSQIDSSTEANALADAALADLKEPLAEMQVPVLYFWPAQLGDLYRFEANPQLFSTAQDLAAVAISDELSRNASRTVFTVRGTPAGGHKRWLEIEARQGVAPSIDTFSNEEADNVTATPTLGGVIIIYDDPRSMSPPINDWATTRCHVSISTGFTPGASNLVGEGRQTRFEVTGLIPGETYYVKLLIIDAAGNVGTISTQQVTAAAEVGPYHQNLDTEAGNVVPNGDFGVRSSPLVRADDAPDRWVPCRQVGAPLVEDKTLWGATNEVYDSETVHETGHRSMLIDPSAGSSVLPGFFNSQLWPITSEQLYVFMWNVQVSNVATSILLRIEFFEEDKTTTAGVLARSGTIPAGSGVWYREIAVYKTSSTARYARALVVQDAGTAGVTYVDLIAALRVLPSFRVYRAGTAQTGAATGATVEFNTETNGHDHGSNYDSVTNFDFIAPHDGDFQFESAFTVTSLPNGNFARANLNINGTTKVSGPKSYNWSGGAVNIMCSVKTSSIQLQRGDAVTIEVGHDTGGNVTIALGESFSYFSGSQNKPGNA